MRDTNRTVVEDVREVASLCGLQRQVLTKSCVEAEGEGETLFHPLSLLEAACSRLYIQQVLRPVVVRQSHAAHQTTERDTSTDKDSDQDGPTVSSRRW